MQRKSEFRPINKRVAAYTIDFPGCWEKLVMTQRKARSKLSLCPSAMLVLFLTLSFTVAAAYGNEEVSTRTAMTVPLPAKEESEKSAHLEFEGAREANQAEGAIRVRISVPHKKRPVSTIMLYPYPPKPPRIKNAIMKLDSKPRTLKNQLLNLGYSGRSGLDKPYVPSGWRWQYAYSAALAKSGTRAPTNIVTFYPWSWKMIPYLKEEVERLNEIETARSERYREAVKEHEQNGVDLETEALQKGLSPVEIKLQAGDTIKLSGSAKVMCGTWWVVATHKVPGLNFFWQLPVRVEAGENPDVQLTQSNALMIEGGW